MNGTMVSNIILLLIGLSFIFAPLQAETLEHQTGSTDPAITIGSQKVFHSKILNEDRKLIIYLPRDYGQSKDHQYPLYVILDGAMNFKATCGMIHSLSEGRVIPRMIVVGIVNTNRWRDLTPVPDISIPGSGGGEKFLECLEKEIIPYITKNWRANGFRVFSGHSLGGITTLNAFVKKPDLFDAFVALSPSLEWSEGVLVSQYKDILKTRKKSYKMLYLSIADEQMERPYYDNMAAFIGGCKIADLKFKSEIFEEEDDHMSIRTTGEMAGIRWIFRDWRLTSNRIYAMTYSQIKEHYKMASIRYKQKRTFSLMPMTDAGYWGIYDRKRTPRAMQLFRLAVKTWPNNPYPYSALGEGLERTGKLKEALMQMEKALKLAKETGVRDIPYYQGMINRVKTKLGLSSR
jgi:predicted alpha/beta superfamily hydrolase